MLSVLLVVSVRFINFWVICRVRELFVFRCWDFRVKLFVGGRGVGGFYLGFYFFFVVSFVFFWES